MATLNNERITGVVTRWIQPRGFGFLSPRDSDRTYFLHISDVPASHGDPKPGEWFSFGLGLDRQGRLKAIDVVPQPEGAR
jgi:cold shock CspA family protein